MAVPQEIKDVKRPSSTVIKESFGRYFVVKRTSQRIKGKKNPQTVDLGTIGEIINGEYVEIRKEPKKITDKKKINIKTYGSSFVTYKVSKDLHKDLKEVFEIDDANKLYVIALLRVIENDIKNRDIKLAYDTSYISELIPNVHLSENTISTFLRDMGLEYISIRKFLEKRASRFKDSTQVIDGTLKEDNSDVNTLSEYSRKGRIKGSKDISLMYSFDLTTKEPITMKAYSGNMLDLRAVSDFITDFKPNNSLLVMDKGFYSTSNIKLFKSISGLSYIIPLQRNSKILKENNMYDGISNSGVVDDKNILYKKVKINEDTYLYSFRDPYLSANEEIAYLNNHKNNDDYEIKKKEFGVISFETNKDIDPIEVYKAYESRWEIETLFKMFKDILDLDTENVHSDYSLITSEFINYLSVIIAQRLKKTFKEIKLTNKNKTIADTYSFKQVMRYLSKIKAIKFKGTKWDINYPANVKYIEELGQSLCIGD